MLPGSKSNGPPYPSVEKPEDPGCDVVKQLRDHDPRQMHGDQEHDEKKDVDSFSEFVPSSLSTKTNVATENHGIPIIDLSNPDCSSLLSQLYQACSTWGFFQLINHDIPASLIADFRNAIANLFALPYEEKLKLKRNAKNARGYFDDELTKRRRDWKECLDVGMPGSGDWDLLDSDERNACLDGYNQFPPDYECGDCKNFREVVIQYFKECARLSNQIAKLMARALGSEEEKLLERMLMGDHSSYLRMNYYPPCVVDTKGNGDYESGHNGGINEPPPLGISPHRDAGFLTVLLQDEDCHSLQVARFEDGDHRDDDADCWVTVHPVPGSLTINTGDMAMIWSNGRFRAPLHRVLTDPCKKRYSAPFFYNPGYSELISPLNCCYLPLDESHNDSSNNSRVNRDDSSKYDDLQPIQYEPCLWGYFRALRFAGDLTDLGLEIQTSHFKVGSTSDHLERQKRFMEEVNFREPFDVEKYRHILESTD